MGLPVLWLGALFSLGWEGCLLGIFYLNPLEWAGVQKRAFPKAKLVVREAYYAQRTADRPPPILCTSHGSRRRARMPWLWGFSWKDEGLCQRGCKEKGPVTESTGESPPGLNSEPQMPCVVNAEGRAYRLPPVLK